MYEVILFDLDGTLTDPKLGITKSVQYALAKFGIKEPDLEKLVHFIGPPLIHSFKESYNFSEEDARQGVVYYREYFTQQGIYENAVFPGIPELLARLQKEGKKLVVATSKPTVFAVQILQHFSLDQFFPLVIGSNLDGTRIEKNEVIEFALSQLAALPLEKTVMVGDRKHDIIGAKHNGIAVIAVAYGYGTSEELAKAEPNYLVSSVKELEILLSKN